jgi:hypothetical protein
LVALHASDPASVYLSVLARSSASTLADVSAAMYERRTLVRWMAMRRTLFLLPRADVPVVQATISTPLAAVLRRRLLSQLKRNGTEPPVDGDLETWLSSLQGRVEHALRARGGATGNELAADVPALRTGAAGGAISAQPAPATSSITPAARLSLLRSVSGRYSPDGPVRRCRWRWQRSRPAARRCARSCRTSSPLACGARPAASLALPGRPWPSARAVRIAPA